MKKCSNKKCPVPAKDLEFNKNGSRRDGLQHRCKICSRADSATQYKKDPEKVRKASTIWGEKNPEKKKSHLLFSRYGITTKQLEDMRLNQDYCCKICGAKESDQARRLNIDHHHASGIVRGLLCTPCNTMLGNAKESGKILSAAIDYLKEFGHLK